MSKSTIVIFVTFFIFVKIRPVRTQTEMVKAMAIGEIADLPKN